ncbi:MAG: glutamate--cysteine ligase [Nocardioides sp.]|nr:glutamate--cysteine ligase [Nocardioides sp.]
MTRLIGIEEEFLIADPATGEPANLAGAALDLLGATGRGEPAQTDEQVEPEFFRPQIEIATPPSVSLEELGAELRKARAVAGSAVASAGGTMVAVGVPPVGSPVTAVTPNERYRRIVEQLGLPAREALSCAMHVHLDIADRDAGIQVADGIRPWLPLILALSANSPFWREQDTSYASWRSEIWRRFPSTGTSEPFGDAAGYDEVSRRMLQWGAALDPAMLYFDVRLSEKAPTVEVRVADVCTDPQDALLVAALLRAVATTAENKPLPMPGPWRSDLHRVALWRGARHGVGGTLVHPTTWELAPARTVFEALLEHCAEALDEAGDTEFVRSAFQDLAGGGGGATRQRARYAATGSLNAVVADLAERTTASWS